MSGKRSRSFEVYVLMLLVLFQGISGIVGGIGLVGDPTGENLRIPISWLEGSPFKDYTIPGWILLIILGIFPLIVFSGLVRGLKTAWAASVIIAVALIIWILVEIIIIGYHQNPPLQLIYGIAGILILIFSLLPSVKKHFRM